MNKMVLLSVVIVILLKLVLRFVDTRRRATAPAFFVYLTKRVFSQLGKIKILLESPSSNLRETRNPKLDTGPRDLGTGLVMIKGR